MAARSRRKKYRTHATTLTDHFLSTEEQLIYQLKQYWVARAFLFCNGINLYLKNNFRNDDILNFIMLDSDELSDLKPAEKHSIIKDQCSRIISNDLPRQGVIFDNLDNISLHFGLSSVEIDIMLFASIMTIDHEFGSCFDVFGRLTNRTAFSLLAHILNIDKQQVSSALQNDAVLSRSGLIKLNNDVNDLDRKLESLDGLASALDTQQPNIDAIFASYIVPSPKPQLKPAHYSHIQSDYDRIALYLKNVTLKNIKGANILIYGPPGTGKTQLVRVLSDHLKLSLNEISVENLAGEILSSKSRITACQLAQNFLEKREKQCLLFDEIEDLFEDDFFSQFLGRSHSSSKVIKGWFNQLLENNAVPTFWLSNNIRSMDDAFLRRFDLVMLLDIPPRSTRLRMLTESLQNTQVRSTWIERMAQLEHLPPAVISRAVHVNDIIGETSADSVEGHLETLISSTLKAMGHKHQLQNNPNATFYDPELINTTAPLAKISAGLKLSNSGRLCLFGPPGTGKSAYAKYISEYLDKPLIAKRASDLIDSYVGGTEQNIAYMFEQANAEQALLLLDEADSFLRDRSNNRYSWETTQVNELLVQMENFDGIFICSTNLMNNLDSAALRRFDFKLEFTYLKTEQAWQLLNGFMGNALKILPADKQAFFNKKLSAIAQLTPGDFAAVRRKLEVLSEQNNVSLFIESLQEEANFKADTPKRSIGFAAEF